MSTKMGDRKIPENLHKLRPKYGKMPKIISPKPIKTAVKTIYTQLLYKINRNTHAEYTMTSLIKAI